MKRYFFRILLAGLAMPFAGSSQNTAPAPHRDSTSTGQTSDTTVKVPKQDTAQQVLTLKECVDLAIKNNLVVQTAGTTSETNRVYRNQAKDYLLPQINGNLNQQLNYGRSITSASNGYVDAQNGNGGYSITGSLLLFNGLYNQHNIRQAQLYYEAGTLDLQQQKDNIAITVIINYLQVLSTQDQLRIARQAAQADSVTVAQYKIKNAQGSVAPSDLADLQGKYSIDMTNVIQFEQSLENFKVTLFSYLNVPYRRDAVYEPVDLTSDIRDLGANSDSLFQEALQIIPNIKANDLRLRSAIQNVKALRGRYWPQLYLNAQIASNYSSLNTTAVPNSDFDFATGQYISVNGTKYGVFGTSFLSNKTAFSDQLKNNRNEYVGLSMSIPILNFLQARNNVKLAKINVEVQRNNATAAKNTLQQQVETAWQNSKAAYKFYVQAKEQVRAYTISLHAADVKFKNGLITSVEYVVVKNNFDNANVNLAAYMYNYVFRFRILDYYEGKLKW